jgi:hypothetical protein
VKTASLPIKVAALALLSGLSMVSASAQTMVTALTVVSASPPPSAPAPAPAPAPPPALTRPQYDFSGTSLISRRVFQRALGQSRPLNPFSRAYAPTTTVVQGANGQTVVVTDAGGAKRPRLLTISLRFAPTLAINTANGGRQYAGFQPNGFGVRYSVGPTFDYFFYRDRYAFSSGLWFTVRRSGYQMPGSFGLPAFAPGRPDQKSVYNLQYLQVPFLLKLFANDLAPGIQLYAQTGSIISVRTREIALDQTRNGLFQYADLTGGYQDQYRLTDFDWTLGVGIQYQIGPVSALNLGISYQRGLTSVALADDLDSRLRTISIDLGFKF